jgi:hypothetical protein
MAQTAPNSLTKPEVARALDQSLVEAMVACLAQVLTRVMLPCTFLPSLDACIQSRAS